MWVFFKKQETGAKSGIKLQQVTGFALPITSVFACVQAPVLASN
jgi:hypothetical protein